MRADGRAARSEQGGLGPGTAWCSGPEEGDAAARSTELSQRLPRPLDRALHCRGWGSEPPFPGLPDAVAPVLPGETAWLGREGPITLPSARRSRQRLATNVCWAAFVSVYGLSTFLEPAAPLSLPKQRPLCRGQSASPLGSFLQALEPSTPAAPPRRQAGLWLCHSPPPATTPSFLCSPDLGQVTSPHMRFRLPSLLQVARCPSNPFPG